jgi:adenylosuccinate lyase
MPHKRNPVLSENLTGLAGRAHGGGARRSSIQSITATGEKQNGDFTRHHSPP